MGHKRTLGLVVSAVLVLVLVLLTIMSACAKPAPQPQEEIVLKAVSTFIKADPAFYFFQKLADRINARGKGKIRVDILGGPEVISIFENFSNLQRGVFDLAQNCSAFHSGEVPGCMVEEYVVTSPAERKESGLDEYLDKMYRENAGVTRLGLTNLFYPGYVAFGNKEQLGTSSWSGLKIRGFPSMQPVIEAMGGSMVTVPPVETYSALEKGVVDGAIFPLAKLPDHKYHEVTKYYAMPPLPWQMVTGIYMRADHFDWLPKDVKELLMDTIDECVDEMYLVQEDYCNRAFRIMEDAGMRAVNIPPDFVPTWNDLAVAVTWEKLVSEAAPQYDAELRKITKPIRMGSLPGD